MVEAPQDSTPLTALAYAKVNLTLEVLGRREDGYHDVATVLQTVSLYDRLTFSPDSEIRVECSVPALSNPDNLAWRAAVALKEATGYAGGARITIEKGIPEAMGLGGGSSDAAATLVALNRLWGLGLTATDLEDVGRDLGSRRSLSRRWRNGHGYGKGGLSKEATPPSATVAGYGMPAG